MRFKTVRALSHFTQNDILVSQTTFLLLKMLLIAPRTLEILGIKNVLTKLCYSKLQTL